MKDIIRTTVDGELTFIQQANKRIYVWLAIIIAICGIASGAIFQENGKGQLLISYWIFIIVYEGCWFLALYWGVHELGTRELTIDTSSRQVTYVVHQLMHNRVFRTRLDDTYLIARLTGAVLVEKQGRWRATIARASSVPMAQSVAEEFSKRLDVPVSK